MVELIVGKKYRVREDLELLTSYGGVAFVGQMEKHEGKFVTIKSKESEGRYRIEEMCYIWTPEMFDLTERIQEEGGFKVGDEIENITTKHRYIVYSVLGDKIGLEGSSYNQRPVYEVKNFRLVKRHIKERRDFEVGDRVKIVVLRNADGSKAILDKRNKYLNGTGIITRDYKGDGYRYTITMDRDGDHTWCFRKDEIELTNHNQKGETKMANKTILKVFGKEKLEDVELIKKHLTGGGEGEAIRQELINEIVIKANKAELLALALELEKEEKLERTNK